MKRTVFAFAVAALTLAAASVSQAAPVAPLPAGVKAGASALTHVQYWRWRHGHWCYWHPRRCHW
jgi:hypothetical protein